MVKRIGAAVREDLAHFFFSCICRTCTFGKSEWRDRALSEPQLGTGP
jgi:hypothetical protein